VTPLTEIGTLDQLVTRAAELWPDRTAWVFDETGRRFTFADVDRESSRFAAALTDRGIGPGDRVAVMLRNQPEFPLIWLALAKIGAQLVPVNTNYQEFDGAHVLRHSGAKLAVAAPEFTDLLSRIGLTEVLTPTALSRESAHLGAALSRESAVRWVSTSPPATSRSTGTRRRTRGRAPGGRRPPGSPRPGP
jgi:crotonobetaine/carnitine-CoA ligase